jgi:uncharacterized membrane protein HdeD (DUF308 family)
VQWCSSHADGTWLAAYVASVYRLSSELFHNGAREDRSMVNLLARRWWIVLIRGILAIVFGCLALTWPGITLATLIILFGAYAFADGFFAVIHAISGRDQQESVWVLLLEGLLGIGVGLITFFEPAMTALILLLYIAVWSLATGVLEIVAAISLRRQLSGEVWMLISGLLSIAFAVILIAHPQVGALAVVWVIGVYAIFFGAVLVALGIRLRSVPRPAES